MFELSRRRFLVSKTVLLATTLCCFLLAKSTMGQGFTPQLGVGYQGNQDVGLDDGYTNFSAFVPLARMGDLVFFSDDYLLLYNDQSDALGSNLGGGARYYNRELDRIFGGYGYYDYCELGGVGHEQVGLGLETLGDIVDARVNLNLPTGGTSDVQIGAAPLANPVFGGPSGQNIVLGYNSFQQALRILDLEGGVLLFGNRTAQLKGYAGAYGLFGDGIEEWGTRGRLEVRANDSVWLNGYLQNDDLFGTTGGFSLEWRFGLGCKRAASSFCCVESRLGDPVQRRRHVAVVNRSEDTLATLGGTAITVLHVDSNATPGGTGGFQDPVDTLLSASNQPQDIVFAHGGSVFTGENMVITTDGQRFLGDGIAHTFSSDQGTFLLPSVNPAGGTPQIVGAPGDAITLANGNEVSNFAITNAASSAVFSAASNAQTSLSSLTIDTTGSHAVNLENQTGDIALDMVAIANAGATGIRISGGGANVTIADSSIDTTANAGLAIDNFSGDVEVTDTNIDNTTGYGVALNNATTNFDFIGGRIYNSAGVGVVGGNNNAVFTTDIDAVGNVDPLGNILLSQTAGSYDFTGSTININSGSGVLIVDSSANASFGNVVATGNTARVGLLNNTGFYTFDGIDVTTNGNNASVTLDNSNSVSIGNIYVINFGGAALAVDNTDLYIGNGSLTSTNGAVISIVDSSIDVTLASAVANTAAVIPIVLSNTTGNGLTITGNGVTPESGGLLQLTGTLVGISLDTVSNVSISFLNVEHDISLGTGVVAMNSVGLMFDNMEIDANRGFVITDSINVALTNNVIAPSANANFEQGIEFQSSVGSGGLGYVISNNVISGLATVGENGITVTNNAGPDIDATIEGNMVTLTTIGVPLPIPTGILIEALGGDVNLTGSSGAGNNTVTAPQSFFATEVGGTVNGQIFVNSVAVP